MVYRDSLGDSEDAVSLQDGQDTLLLDEKDFRSSPLRLTYLSRYHHHMLLVIELIMLVINVGMLVFTFVFAQSQQTPSFHANVRDLRAYEAVEAPFSPAIEHLQYNIQTVDTEDEDDPFTGDWRPELDVAWDRLMTYNTMKFTADEIRAIGQPAVEFSDGSGYYGFLEVYHQLHCIQRIYQSHYPEKYPELAAGGFLGPAHWNHCLQVLRKGVMCNPQMGINTMIRDDDAPFANLTALIDIPRKCVDWTAFEKWAESRANHTGVVELMQTGKLADNGPPDVWAEWQRTH